MVTDCTQEFYAALFPAWKWNAPKEDDPDDAVQFTFEQPSGTRCSTYTALNHMIDTTQDSLEALYNYPQVTPSRVSNQWALAPQSTTT